MAGTSLPTHVRQPSLASLHSLIPPPSLRRHVLPLFILVGIVLASASQTEFASYLTGHRNYNQPYFTFFLTHITFSLIFPLHILLLAIIYPRISISTYLDGLLHIIAQQLGKNHEPGVRLRWADIAHSWCWRVTWLTLLVSVPALSWFVAMVYTTAMDVTAIYATSSFHAYFFSMVLLGQPLSRITAGSIALAFIGVIVISLDGLKGDAGDGDLGQGEAQDQDHAPDVGSRMFGDLVMMAGAVLLGLYEVVYKMVLPEPHEVTGDDTSDYSPLSPSAPLEDLDTTHDNGLTPPISVSPPPTLYHTARRPERMSLSSSDRRMSRTPLLSPVPGDSHIQSSLILQEPRGDVPELPPALLANFLTSCLGVATLIMLWVPIPILHWTGVEIFRWPSGWDTWAQLGVVAWGGALYNAGLMVLIGIWGPTTSSVANLLTIGLVAVVDAVWMGHVPDLQTLLGVGMICIGFGVLLYEGEG